MKIRLLLALAGFVLPTFAQQTDSTAEATPPTLEDNFGHILPDRRVMGGLQSTETGIVHLGYFSWIGAFSPTLFPGDLSDRFQNALQDPNKINGNLRLFEIVTGDNDIWPWLTEFESQLRELKIQHVDTVVPGSHNMFVWRPALYNFLQKNLQALNRQRKPMDSL